MKEEEKKAIENIEKWLNKEENYCTDEDIKTVLNLIETQKAEIEKRDKMIDLMIDTILKNDDNYWYLFDANKKAIEEYFTKLVEGEKKDE